MERITVYNVPTLTVILPLHGALSYIYFWLGYRGAFFAFCLENLPNRQN